MQVPVDERVRLASKASSVSFLPLSSKITSFLKGPQVEAGKKIAKARNPKVKVNKLTGSWCIALKVGRFTVILALARIFVIIINDTW